MPQAQDPKDKTQKAEFLSLVRSYMKKRVVEAAAQAPPDADELIQTLYTFNADRAVDYVYRQSEHKDDKGSYSIWIMGCSSATTGALLQELLLYDLQAVAAMRGSQIGFKRNNPGRAGGRARQALWKLTGRPSKRSSGPADPKKRAR